MQAFKVLLLFISFWTANELLAQTSFGKVKCDSFIVMEDTSRAIIYRKNKTAVFDKNKRKFLLKPTKDILFYLGEQDLLVRVAKNDINFIYLNEDKESISFANNTLHTIMAEFPILSGGILDSIVRFNSIYFNYKNATVPADEITEDFWPVTAYSVERLSNDLLVINYVKIPTGHFDFEFEQEVMDDPGIAASGLYSMDARKWLIPAIYESIKLVGNSLVCLKRDPIVPEFVSFSERYTQLEHSYDFYRIKNAGEVDLVQTNITHNADIDLAILIGVDSIKNRFLETNVISNQYITFKNGLQGLSEFQLFNAEDYGQMGYSNFIYTEIFAPTFDYVLNDPNGGNIITLDSSLTNRLSLHRWQKKEGGDEFELIRIVQAKNQLLYSINSSNSEQVLVDGHLYNWPELIKVPGFETPIHAGKTIKYYGFPHRHDKSCGLQFFNDNLLYVLNYENDYNDPFVMPLKSAVYPADDSMIGLDDGDVLTVYPGPIPGYEKSGVFNLKNNQWLVTPDYQMIHNRSNGLLLQGVERRDYGLYYKDSYNLLQMDGTYIFQNVISGETGTDLAPYKEVLLGENHPITYFEYPEKSIYREDFGYEGDFYQYIGDYFAVVTESGDWQIQQPIKGDNIINPIPVTKPAEFVHYNPSYFYFFWMDQDSIYLEIGGGLHAASRQNGKINLDIMEMEDDEEWRIHLISGEDTLVRTSYMFSNQPRKYTTASFFVKDDLLFINEPQLYDNITPNAYALDGYWEEYLEGILSFKIFETETSYICQLVDGVWKKVTPYYASIQTIPFGYLVSTGSEEEMVDQENHSIVERPSSYLILDTNFKAISYLDFFDFPKAIIHPFGVQLCDEKCFLIDNNGKMLTNAKWDEFLIEAGQIKAIRYKLKSETEEWLLGKEREIEEFKYFPLPKD